MRFSFLDTSNQSLVQLKSWDDQALYSWSLEMRKVGVWNHRHWKKCKMHAVGKRPSWSLSGPLAGWLALISAACCGCEPKAINLISLTGLTDEIESCFELSHWSFSCLWSACDPITAKLQYLHCNLHERNCHERVTLFISWRLICLPFSFFSGMMRTTSCMGFYVSLPLVPEQAVFTV